MSGKMTITFDAQSYGDLLVRYQPKPIATEMENDRAIALAEELEHRSDRSIEEETLLDLLLTLIEKFESEHYPIPAGTSGSMVRHLMEARDLRAADLIPVLGDEETIAAVLNDGRSIELHEARELAHFFGVDVELLLV